MVILRSFYAILSRNSFAVVVSQYLSMKIYQNSTKLGKSVGIFIGKKCMRKPLKSESKPSLHCLITKPNEDNSHGFKQLHTPAFCKVFRGQEKP